MFFFYLKKILSKTTHPDHKQYQNAYQFQVTGTHTIETAGCQLVLFDLEKFSSTDFSNLDETITLAGFGVRLPW